MEKLNNPINKTYPTKILDVIETNSLINSYSKLLGIDISSSFREVQNIFLLECQVTGYQFFYPFTIAGDDKFYENLQVFNWYYCENKWEFNVARQFITNGSLLEIGCGNGDFLKSLKSIKNLQLQGFELNQEAIKKCQSKGLNVSAGNLEQFLGLEFDYIVNFQVLEHLSDINSFFDNCYKILSTDSKLIIGVPNTDSFVFKPYKKEKYLQHPSLLLNMPPHHMGWWNAKTLEKVANEFGFICEHVIYEKMSFERIELVVNNLKSYYFFKFISNRLLKVFFQKFYLYFKGETMVMILRKKK